MSGQTLSRKEKKKAMELFIQQHNPYKPLIPLKFDLRKYSTFVEENNLKQADITREMLQKFTLS